jgi:outer membrane protein OmpA-like peptidoglycan-associated protein
MRRAFRGLLFTGLIVSIGLLVGCAEKKQVKLEMVRETVVAQPEIESLTTEPGGRLDTREQGHRVRVILRGDPGLEATFDVAGRFEGRTMEELEPGVYVGSFEVASGDTGPVHWTGRLLHPPSGALREATSEGQLTLFRSSPPPREDVCTAEKQAAFDTALGGLVLYFAFDDYELTEEARAQIDAQLQVIQAHAPCEIYVLGHTDQTGDDSYNMRLSTYRAIEVSKYLWAKGIDGDRIRKAYFGKKWPRETPEQSRRVELRARNPYAGKAAE